MHTLRDVEAAFNEGKMTLVEALQKAYEMGGESIVEIVKRVKALPHSQTEGLNGRGTTWL